MKEKSKQLFAKSHLAFLLMALFLPLGYAVAADVKGKVTDDKSAALNGVTVSVKGKGTSAVTDAAGTFTISADEASVLVFSYVGFDTKEVTVGSQSIVNV